MKRDMELIRKILFDIEEKYMPGNGKNQHIEVTNYDSDIVMEHLLLMYDAGLIQSIQKASTLDQPIYLAGNLTNEGYDLLDKIRENTVWNKTKQIAKEKGLPMIVETVKVIATAIITAATEGIATAILKNGGQQ